MVTAQPFSKAPPIIIFGGQGSSSLFSAASSRRAREDAERSLHGALLLSRWHAVLLEEFKTIDQASQRCVQLSPQGFLHQKDLLEIPKRLHTNSLIQAITICLYQLLHYVAELECGSLNTDSYSDSPILETTGICSGLLSAAVAAASKDVSDVVCHGVEALRLAFYVGAQVMLRSQTIVSDLDNAWSWCLIVNGLTRGEVSDALGTFSEKIGGEFLRISAVSTPTMISITGPPSNLARLQQHIGPMAVTKFAHIHGWYHGGEPLEVSLQEISKDIERRKIRFPGVEDLQVPIRSTLDGSVLNREDLSEDLASWVLEHMLLHPVDWIETTGSFYSSVEANASQDQDSPQDVLCFGPSSESLFMELRARDRKNLLRLLDLSPFRASINGYDQSSTIRDDDVAIVGMGVNLPRGQGVEELWETLSTGLSAVSEIPDSRFDVSFYNTSAKMNGQRSMATRYGAFLDNIWDFDNEFFAISPREARSMDPQQRLLLHTSQAALDDAGYAPNSSPTFSEASFGCYVGLATGDYTDNLRDDIDVFYSTGTLRAFHSGRISFTHNFSGPSITTDTACSSSLVSIYHACRALRNGDCTAAVAGGVNTISSPDMYLGLSRGHFLSSSGGCKPFDASADGYCRAEGCAVFVLKRLSCAVAENDNIHAIIKSVELNQSGTAPSITHPHSETQYALFRKTLHTAGVDPATVDLVEAHGTGTAAGDPCELSSLRSAFESSHSSTHPLVVSSIKGNIGHCEAASGAAGLAKLLLALRHKVMPAQGNFQTPNPRLQGLDNGVMVIPTQNRPWSASTHPRRALLNNFGAAGSNGALLLEEFRDSSSSLDLPRLKRSSFVFNLSAKSSSALSRMVNEHKKFLKSAQSLHLVDVCYTATARRPIYSHRMSFNCPSIQNLISKFENFQLDLVKPIHAVGPTVFVFSGQGSLYTGMGWDLYEQSPHFQQTITRCNTIVENLGFPSFMSFIRSHTELSDADYDIVSSQCACFSLEYSLASLLMSWNLIPDSVIGHSLGEYAALAVAGTLTLEDAIRVVATRACLMKENCVVMSTGMSAIRLSPSDAIGLIKSDANLSELVVACRNSDHDCVVAGSLDELDHLESICKTRDIKATRVPVPFAYHSPAMEPIYDALKMIGRSIKWYEPKIPVRSTVHGRLLRLQDLDDGYFANHARQPVCFAEALRDMEKHVKIEDSIFFEIGPHPITLPMVRSQFGSGGYTLLSTLQKGKDDWDSINESLTKVALIKSDINWRAVFEGSGAKMISLPGYPLQGETFCVAYKEPQRVVDHEHAEWTYREAAYTLLRRYRITSSPTDNQCYELATTMANLSPLIAGHVVGGVAICPASVYHELILETIAEFMQLDEHQRPVISNLQFPQPLVENTYANSDSVYVRALRQGEDALHISVCLKDPSQVENGAVCTANVLIIDTRKSNLQGVKDKALALRQISYLKNSEGQSTFQPHILYSSVFTRVVTYSEIYQTLNQFTVSSSCLEGEGTFTLPKQSRTGVFVTNPMFLDTLFHAAGFIANLGVPTGEICICGRIDTVEVVDPDIDMSQEFKIYCSLVDEIKGIFLADSYVLDAGGNVVAVARGMEFKRLRLKTFQHVLQSAVVGSAGMPDMRPPDLVKDATSKTDPETSSSGGSNTPSTPKNDRNDISTTVLRAVSDASGFPESRLQSSVPLEHLGIDSMMQIEITAKLQKAFPGNSLDHRNLSDCKTIQALEEVLQTALMPSPEESASNQDATGNSSKTSEQDGKVMEPQRDKYTATSATSSENPMVIQHSTSGRTPVFLVHDGSGQINMYGRMNRVKDRQIYAFRDVNGVSDLGKRRGLSVMASEYASSILTLEAPSVILGGWSFGGVVALEIAKQLTEAGVSVRGLILIDSPYPGNHQPLPKEIASAVVDSIDGLIESKSKSRILEAFERHASMLGAYTPPTGSNFMTVALRSSQVIPTQEIYGVDYLWLSSQETRDEATDKWRKLIGGRLESLMIPGNHFEAFDEDNIAQTSAQFASACEIIDGRS